MIGAEQLATDDTDCTDEKIEAIPPRNPCALQSSVHQSLEFHFLFAEVDQQANLLIGGL
jgi:hypothetical protein